MLSLCFTKWCAPPSEMFGEDLKKDVLARLPCAMKAGDNLCSIKLPQKTQEAHFLI
jgi:hypothetical protein